MIADDNASEIPVCCLVVDDLEANLFAMAALLRRDGVEVLTARSGVEALELLLAHDVALALIDVQMPEMDGFELAELIRGTERTSQIPLIFITAGEHEQRRVFKGYDSGAVDFLYKPINAHILRSKADVFFQLYRQHRQLAHELEIKTETLRLNELFVGVLGHDLRNPLTTVLTTAESLRTHEDADVAKAGGWIYDSAERMSRLIEDTLDLVRVRIGGGIGIRAAPMDLGEVVGRIVEEHRIAHPGRVLAFECHGPLGGAWDGERIAQVASNLIGNALRHGAADIPVQVIASRASGCVELTVSNGGDIDAALLPHIFDPFRGTRERDRGRYGGLGLGLYIVQQIALAHGGSVDVVTGTGTTTFVIALPARAQPAAARSDAGTAKA